MRHREAAVRLDRSQIPGCRAGCWGSAVSDLDPHVSMVDFKNRSLGFLIRKMEEQCLWRLAWRVPEAGKGSHAWGTVEDCARGQGASQGPEGGTPGRPRKPSGHPFQHPPHGFSTASGPGPPKMGGVRVGGKELVEGSTFFPGKREFAFPMNCPAPWEKTFFNDT